MTKLNSVVLWTVMLAVIGNGLDVEVSDVMGAEPAEALPNVLRISQGDLCLVLGEKATLVEERAAGLFAREVKTRTGLEIGVGRAKSAKHALAVGTTSSCKAIQTYCGRNPNAAKLGKDGFHLATKPKGGDLIYVVGQSPSGVMAGVGKLLRLCSYSQGFMEIPPVTKTEAPKKPLRGMYLWTVEGASYMRIPDIEKIDRIIENLALWGCNSLAVWPRRRVISNMKNNNQKYRVFAEKHISRLKHFGRTAKSLGMEFGIAFISDHAFEGSVCPSTPEGLAKIKEFQEEVLGYFPHLDFVWSWCYDPGGCKCEKCRPYGSNGFLRSSEQLAGIWRKRFPKGRKIIPSTWYMSDREVKGIVKYMNEKKPDWWGTLSCLSKFVAEIAKGKPDEYEVALFPEITMISGRGFRAANPIPDRTLRYAREQLPVAVGGWPYTEGIYDDVNKFLWLQLFWSFPDRSIDDILSEYASFYLSRGVAGDAVKMLYGIEKTNRLKVKTPAGAAKADEVWRLTQEIDSRLPLWAKDSWRWRVLYIRAALDHYWKDPKKLTPESRAALEPLLKELRRIYHSDRVLKLPKQQTPQEEE